MNTIFTPPLTQEEECKRALAKIYTLLLKLADKSEHSSTSSEINPNEEKVAETAPVPLHPNIPPSAL